LIRLLLAGMHGDDIGVLQPRRDPRFGQKPPQYLGAARKARPRLLDGHLAAQLTVVCEPHIAHRALAALL
jgi:hypothetical protein